ncbi:MAG TPA: hypothetical protein VGI81_24545 [Tepidisphaeraceae bacterium]|jgi:hypothetical protein
MASKRGTPHKPKKTSPPETSGKVGSDRAADREIGGKLDFGIPADQAKAPLPDGGMEKGPEPGTGPMRSGATGVRDSGVGHAPGGPGAGSGGDLDPDFIGLDGKGGVAARPASGRIQGPDITEGGSAPFASGPPARGENELPAGTHGGPPEIVIGSTVDRGGGDASTTGPESGVSPNLSPAAYPQLDVPDDEAAGEVRSDRERPEP